MPSATIALLGIAGLGPLGLDHHQRKAVDVAHDVRRAVMRALGGQHLAALGHIPPVGRRVGPVDDGDGGLMLLAVRHELGDGDAQRQLVVEPLVGGQQALAGRCSADNSRTIWSMALGDERVATRPCSRSAESAAPRSGAA